MDVISELYEEAKRRVVLPENVRRLLINILAEKEPVPLPGHEQAFVNHLSIYILLKRQLQVFKARHNLFTAKEFQSRLENLKDHIANWREEIRNANYYIASERIRVLKLQVGRNHVLSKTAWRYVMNITSMG